MNAFLGLSKPMSFVVAAISGLGWSRIIMGALILALSAALTVQTIRLYREQARASDDAAALAVCRSTLAAHDAALAAQERARAAAERARAEAVEQGRRAVQQAEREQRQAEAALADFRSRWASRPPSCAIALGQMQLACESTIGDY